MSEINEVLAEGTATFVVSGNSGDPAPQKLTLRPTINVAISSIRATIEATLPTGAIVEVWVLKFGGNPTVDTDYTFNANLISGTNLSGLSFPYARAVQIRAKRGSVDGNITVHATAI